jgi:hypothetical protein
MNAKQLLAAMPIAAMAACSVDATKISHDDLVSILEIRKWTIPMPKDQRLEWSFEIREYREFSSIPEGQDDWADSSRTASFILMPTGEGDIYRFWLTQLHGTSSGKTRIDVCGDADDDLAAKCDVGQFETVWYPKPICIEDAKTYLVGETRETFAPGRRRQIVLKPGKFRLEDMNDDQ